MKIRKLTLTLTALAGTMLLSACGGNEEAEPAADEVASDAAATATLANGMTVKEQIEARQAGLKKVGKAFKTISDNLKLDTPDIAAIQEAATSIPTATEGMADWFPEGTGPDSGIKTDALPAIWESKDDFLAKESAFQEAATKLVAATETGDIAAIEAAFKETGGTCKACHDKYRLDD